MGHAASIAQTRLKPRFCALQTSPGWRCLGAEHRFWWVSGRLGKSFLFRTHGCSMLFQYKKTGCLRHPVNSKFYQVFNWVQWALLIICFDLRLKSLGCWVLCDVASWVAGSWSCQAGRTARGGRSAQWWVGAAGLLT